jgi:hypothetical protein
MNRRRRNRNRNRRNIKNNNYIMERVDSIQNDDIDKIEIVDDIDYTLDGSVKQLFLNLTKMQIVFNKENTLEPFFPKGMEKDEHGNYFLKIGESKTMFCGHLDTYCTEYKRVYHVISGDTIKTKNSTLGGDDKAGIVIMIKMIEARIPGLYYFFRGEEGKTSPIGTWGSKQALKTYPDLFKKYDRCIAFDRRGFDSIISQQMYGECCSSEFVKELEKQMTENGLKYEDDITGMWCDSGVFMEVIPECTNISVGYLNEHTLYESQDIVHLEKLVDVCLKVKWELLPVKRDPKTTIKRVGKYKYSKNWNDWDNPYYLSLKKYKQPQFKYTGNYTYNAKDIFDLVEISLEQEGYECLNVKQFDEAEKMFFTNYITGDFFGIRIIDNDIYMSEDNTLRNYLFVGDIETFYTYIKNKTIDDEIDSHLKSISSEIKNKNVKNYDEYTQNQEDAFLYIVENDSKLIKEIINNIINSKDITKFEISGTQWINLSKLFYDLKIIKDYGDYGINPDEFIDWLKDNLKEKDSKLSKEILNKKDNIQYVPFIEIGDKSKFINNIHQSNFFTKQQYEIFSGLIDNEKELVNLMIKDFEISDDTMVRLSTLNHISDILKYLLKTKILKFGEREINEKEFEAFVWEYIVEIKKFYEKTKKTNNDK